MTRVATRLNVRTRDLRGPWFSTLWTWLDSLVQSKEKKLEPTLNTIQAPIKSRKALLLSQQTHMNLSSNLLGWSLSSWTMGLTQQVREVTRAPENSEHPKSAVLTTTRVTLKHSFTEQFFATHQTWLTCCWESTRRRNWISMPSSKRPLTSTSPQNLGQMKKKN